MKLAFYTCFGEFKIHNLGSIPLYSEIQKQMHTDTEIVP